MESYYTIERIECSDKIKDLIESNKSELVKKYNDQLHDLSSNLDIDEKCRSKETNEINKLLSDISSTYKQSYGGSYCSLYMRVNSAIELKEVGFFGPCDSEESDFVIFIEVYRPKGSEIFPECIASKKIYSQVSNVSRVNLSEIFYVPLESSPYIHPSTWHLIQFRIEGGETMKGLESVTEGTVLSESGDEIKFEFSVGPKQLPRLKFKQTPIQLNEKLNNKASSRSSLFKLLSKCHLFKK